MMVILKKNEDAKDTPPEPEEEMKNIVDTLKEVNLGIDDDMRPTYVSASLNDDEVRKHIELLMELRDLFSWRYKEIPGVDPRVVVHRLVVK